MDAIVVKLWTIIMTVLSGLMPFHTSPMNRWLVGWAMSEAGRLFGEGVRADLCPLLQRTNF
ncbi:MAG: hypothetical protein ACREE6_09665 [Limisphaerales bacterium]